MTQCMKHLPQKCDELMFGFLEPTLKLLVNPSTGEAEMGFLGQAS